MIWFNWFSRSLALRSVDRCLRKLHRRNKVHDKRVNKFMDRGAMLYEKYVENQAAIEQELVDLHATNVKLETTLAAARDVISAHENIVVPNLVAGQKASTERWLADIARSQDCLLYTSPSPRDQRGSRMPSSA